MKISYDPDTDALYIIFKKRNYKMSKELERDIIFDYSKDNEIIGVEILNASKKLPKKELKTISFDILVK
ncbi:MAG: DUF2283 domain-containing protein [Thermoplasmata archaeon]|nr:DUF2283 domain-containing protein [Thermoplasmata archaeon]